MKTGEAGYSEEGLDIKLTSATNACKYFHKYAKTVSSDSTSRFSRLLKSPVSGRLKDKAVGYSYETIVLAQEAQRCPLTLLISEPAISTKISELADVQECIVTGSAKEPKSIDKVSPASRLEPPRLSNWNLFYIWVPSINIIKRF